MLVDNLERRVGKGEPYVLKRKSPRTVVGVIFLKEGAISRFSVQIA